MSSSPLLREPSPRRSRLRTGLAALGAALVAVLYAAVVLTQPADAATGHTQVAGAVLFVGYLLAALLLLAGTLPELSVGTVALIPVALALNILLGQFVGSTLVPLYLDSLGTILIGFLAGRRAGTATGVLSSLVWSLFNPTLLPFASVAGVVGFCAGQVGRWNLVRKVWPTPILGALTGVLSGVVAAPVAAFVYGGTSGAATGAIVSAFRAYGDSILAATTKQALISDPGDKAVCFLVASLIVLALPRRVSRRVARGAK